MKILIIGGGNMGLTYAQSFLNAHIVSKEQMLILERSNQKATQLKKLDIGTVYGEAGEFIKTADLIILAVKPQDTKALFENISPFINNSQVVLSVMAGLQIGYIAKKIGTPKIIRAMPNLLAQIGVGMTVFNSSPEVSRMELVMVQNLLSSTGKTVYVENENLLDAATAISGSGPAYVFYFMQMLIQAAQEMGFSASEAELLSYQTFKGAVESFNKFNLNCQEWIDKVTSRGGTTEAAFKPFNENALGVKILDGIQAAKQRATELSKQ